MATGKQNKANKTLRKSNARALATSILVNEGKATRSQERVDDKKAARVGRKVAGTIRKGKLAQYPGKASSALQTSSNRMNQSVVARGGKPSGALGYGIKKSKIAPTSKGKK